MARGVLTLAALVNLSLLLVSLQIWQIYQPTGMTALLPMVPDLVGVLVVVGIALRMGQSGSRLPDTTAYGPDRDVRVHRDDDRFWKGGMIYANHDGPALMVAKRFGVGWTVNFGNSRALLLMGGIVTAALIVALWSALAGR